MKVEAVALSVGYRSKKNFYQQFKRHYGMTPVPYRCACATSSHTEQRRLASRSDQPSRVEPVATAADAGRRRTTSPETCAPKRDPILERLSHAIRASNRAWRTAMRAQELLVEQFVRIQIGILITNDAGRYIGANDAAITATGYSTLELYDVRPAELFVAAPRVDPRCVWQLLRPSRLDGQSNATIKTKAGNFVGINLVTLRNLLWGRSEMSAMLEALPSAAAS